MKAPHIFWQRPVGPLGCNCYIVGDEIDRSALVVDPGGDVETIQEAIAGSGLRIEAIVATHAHFDHVIAAEALRAATGAPFFLHAGDKPLLEWVQESGRLFLGIELPPPPDIDSEAREDEVLRTGEVGLRIVHTPGHSPGSISLVGDGLVFAGDTLFAGSVGRSDLPGGDGDALVKAVHAKLFTLDDGTVVYPGHGPATTIGEEKRSNPFVGLGRGL